jgi:CubicO group peptidase (beta-lactamase class C family)
MHADPGRIMNLSRRSALFGAGFGLLGPRMVLAQPVAVVTRENVDRRLPELDNFVLETLRQTGVPGLSLAIVYRDQVVHLKGFGVRQAGKSEPVDPDTVFQLASVSKPVASTVVAALVGDGLVAWDDPIVRHDPAFAMHDAWVTRQVTLRDMFCHRSGLPDHAGDALEDIGYDRTEVLHRLRYIKPHSSFRSHYAYTNFGLTAAAVAAAKAGGKSWEDVSAQRLYQPLGMKNTSSRFADFMASPNRAVGHVRQGGAWVAKYTRDPDAQSPAGGVSSSVRDMALWLRLQLGRGTVDGREIVEASSLDETHRPQIVSTPAENPMVDRSGFYGLGWGVGYDEQGRIRWSHSGGFNLGAATCVNVLPTEQIGIVALANTHPIGVPEAVCRTFLDLLLTGKVERDWLTLFGQVLAKAMAPEYGTSVDYSKPPNPQLPALAAAAYVGGYHNDLYGATEIVGTDTGLVLKLGPKQASFALRHFERDVFTYQPVGENAYGPSAVTFMVGADRKAASVTIENLDSNGQGTFRRASG